MPCLRLAALVAFVVVSAVPAGLGAKSARATTHVVYPGQTLGMIAKRYRVSIEELCAANGIARRAKLRPGQKLVVPVPGAPPAAPGTPPASPPPAPARPAATSVGRTPAQAERPAPSRSHAQKPRKRGLVHWVSTTGEYRGFVFDKKGRLLERARPALERVFAAWRTGESLALDVKLLRHLVAVSDHFGGRTFRIVSGYRPRRPDQYTRHSRHNVGRAVDFSIPGVPNAEIRDFCRSLGAVGVGYYPNSSFVHLDVRERPTYWVDFSGPGERPRYANGRGQDPGVAPAAEDDDDHDDDDSVPPGATAPEAGPASPERSPGPDRAAPGSG